MRSTTVSILLGLMVVFSPAAYGHGIWGHVHVTGWAIENLPPGEVRDFFSDPEVFNAALFGAAFTDSGYWPQRGDLSVRSRAYSEHTHWEPFIQDFVEWVLANDPPPWDDIESRRRVAFLIGAACHGLQDEIFDSLFLLQVGEEDGGGQSEADPATDGFLALDAHLRFVPEPYIPYDVLIELYAGLDEGVDRATIEASVEAMVFLYVREGGWITAEGLGNQYSEQIPWTRAHYMDPGIPGSLRAEIVPTGAYVEAVWERLHDRFDTSDVVVATYPEVPRRLLSHETGTPDSLVTLVFGMGVSRPTVETLWRDAGGEAVAHTTQGTRWGNSFPRLVRLDPSAVLEPGGWYTAGLAAGAVLIDEAVTDSDFEFEFQVECTEGSGSCEAVDVPAPAIDRSLFGDDEPDEEVGVDAGPDAGDEDVDAPDAGDVARSDTVADASADTATSDEGDVRITGGSRGCATARRAPCDAVPALLLLLALQLSMRTGRRRTPH